MMSKVHNFNAGPAVLPQPVLAQVQSELLDYQGQGMSIMEMSHRSKLFEGIVTEAEARVKRLAGVGEDYRALFLQGGASMQFAMVPMNFLKVGTVADFLMTGAWADKALEEAGKLGQARVAATTREEGYRRMPHADEISLSNAPAYVHITSNETIQGTQWHAWPDVGDRPLVGDMSSDIFSRPLDAGRFALIYGGAQKNLGPSGITLVLARSSFLDQGRSDIPTFLRYSTHAKNNSLYNTPPTFGIYMLNLVLKWIEDQGGLGGMERRNQQKAAAVYGAVDRSGGFYKGHAAPEARSLMNITFRLPSEELEKQFVAEATKAGMVGLAGHRSVGGIRASIYNALEQESCQVLAEFMDEFLRREG